MTYIPHERIIAHRLRFIHLDRPEEARTTIINNQSRPLYANTSTLPSHHRYYHLIPLSMYNTSSSSSCSFSHITILCVPTSRCLLRCLLPFTKPNNARGERKQCVYRDVCMQTTLRFIKSKFDGRLSSN